MESKLRATTDRELSLVSLPLKPARGGQDEAAREEAQREWHNLDAQTGEHGPLVGHQAAIGLSCDLSGRNIEKGRIMSGPNAGARLEFGGHRARAKYGDANAVRCKLRPQGLGEGNDIGLGRVIDRHAGAGQIARDRSDAEKTPVVPGELIGKAQRQIRQGPDIDIDDAELLDAVALDCVTKYAEAGIVDEIVELDAFGDECGRDLLAGLRILEIAGDHDRLLSAPGGG